MYIPPDCSTRTILLIKFFQYLYFSGILVTTLVSCSDPFRGEVKKGLSGMRSASVPSTGLCWRKLIGVRSTLHCFLHCCLKSFKRATDAIVYATSLRPGFWSIIHTASHCYSNANGSKVGHGTDSLDQNFH